MPSNALDAEDRSLRNHLIAGSGVALFLILGIGGWAFRTELAGAVTASGSVVVDSNVKKVQHLTGGSSENYWFGRAIAWKPETR